MKKITALILIAVSSFAVGQNYSINGKPIMTVRNQDQLREIPPGTPIMPAQAAVIRNAIPAKTLHFVNGKARLSGIIRGLNMAAYRFYGHAGEHIKIVPNGNNYAMEFALFDPQRGMRFGSVHTLPENSEYEVRIVQTRKNAAYNKKAYKYDVSVYLNKQAQIPSTMIKQSTASHTGPAIVMPAATVTTTTTTVTNAQKMAVSPAPVSVNNTQTAAMSGKGKSRHYRCQNGTTLLVEYFNLNSKMPIAVIRSNQGNISLTLDAGQSVGKNIIFTDSSHTLHLISANRNLATAEVLSFEQNGTPAAIACKPQ